MSDSRMCNVHEISVDRPSECPHCVEFFRHMKPEAMSSEQRVLVMRTLEDRAITFATGHLAVQKLVGRSVMPPEIHYAWDRLCLEATLRTGEAPPKEVMVETLMKTGRPFEVIQAKAAICPGCGVPHALEDITVESYRPS